MQPQDRRFARHQAVFAQQIRRQILRDHLPILQQRLSDRFAHPGLRDFAANGIDRLQAAAAQRPPVGKLRIRHGELAPAHIPFSG
ncbi:hypothetical protein D3C81_1656740 [compost metagenome]